MIDDQQALTLASEAQAIKTKAVTVLVRSPREYELAVSERGKIKLKYKDIEARRVFLKAPALESCRRIDDFFRDPLKFLKDADGTIEKALIAYQKEEAHQAEEEQKRRDAEAKAQREALEAQAKKEREEADKAAAELQRKAKEAREAGDLSTAVSMTHQANILVEASEERAVEIESQAQTIIAEKARPEIPVVQGVSKIRTIWRHRVTNKKLLPEEYKVANDKMLADVGKATEGKAVISGVEFYPEEILPQRTA